MPQSPLLPVPASALLTLEETVARYSSAIFLADEYLSARGIDPEVRDGFRLGVVEDPAPGHEPYEGYLAIPYLGKKGKVLTVRFRCIEDHGAGVKCKDLGHGKYRTLPHDPARMFNVRAVLEAEKERTGDIHITEGELDTVILTQLGLHAVALPGANQWQDHHPRMLASVERAYVWADPDHAGAEFAGSVISSMRGRAQQVPLKIGDVNETYLKGGAEALKAAMERLTWA